MRRICRQHGWPPQTWRNLPREDRVTLLGYDRWRDKQRESLREKLPVTPTWMTEYLLLTMEMI